MAADLKPCPFCGARAFGSKWRLDNGAIGGWVECEQCDVRMSALSDYAGAVAAWNRHGVPELREALQALLKLHIAHHNTPEHVAARAALSIHDLGRPVSPHGSGP